MLLNLLNADQEAVSIHSVCDRQQQNGTFGRCQNRCYISYCATVVLRLVLEKRCTEVENVIKDATNARAGSTVTWHAAANEDEHCFSLSE